MSNESSMSIQKTAWSTLAQALTRQNVLSVAAFENGMTIAFEDGGKLYVAAEALVIKAAKP